MAFKETHGGAKNGGGHWGTRHEAKTTIKRSGRRAARREIKRWLAKKSEVMHGL